MATANKEASKYLTKLLVSFIRFSTIIEFFNFLLNFSASGFCVNGISEYFLNYFRRSNCGHNRPVTAYRGPSLGSSGNFQFAAAVENGAAADADAIAQQSAG